MDQLIQGITPCEEKNQHERGSSMDKPEHTRSAWHISGLLLIMLASLTACAGASSFKGPGFDTETGQVKSDKDTVMVGLTHPVLGDRFFKNVTFWRHSVKVVRSLENNPGFIGFDLRTSIWDGEAWTVTVWEDEASLDSFITSPTHQTAIREGWSALVTAEFARVSVPRAEIPLSWERVETLMKEHGRLVKAEGQKAPSYGGPE
jgi:heme-degrading monooxygenase HmoA